MLVITASREAVGMQKAPVYIHLARPSQQTARGAKLSGASLLSRRLSAATVSEKDATVTDQNSRLLAAGQGRAGQGRAGQGRAGQGRAGQGAASRDIVFCLFVLAEQQNRPIYKFR